VTETTTAPAPTAPEATSLFVNGLFPRRRALTLLLSLLGGLLLAYAWSSNLADDEIGFNTADQLLGHNAQSTPLTSIAAGVLFAFVSGLAGSFTACNVAVFGAVGPLVGQISLTRRQRLVHALRPLGWMAAGMLPVSAAYGVLVGLVGTHMPQFSSAVTSGISPRIAQAMIVFGLIGLFMLVLGLAAVGLIPDPLAALARRRPNAPLVLMGAMVGGFLIGRPYPLFHALFRHAADEHNPLYGAVAFSLQSIGNILVMSVLFLTLSYVFGRPVQRWLATKPGRVATLTASAFLVAGAFTVIYWDVRLLGSLHYIWFPQAPWNT
jgi:MFS family permease